MEKVFLTTKESCVDKKWMEEQQPKTKVRLIGRTSTHYNQYAIDLPAA